MNVVFIDSDCRKYFEQEAALKQLLQDPQCQVHFWDPDNLPQVQERCRFVLISAMSSGVRNQHRELFRKYANAACWVITVLGVSLKGEQNQLMTSLDSVMAKCAVPYRVVFEAPDLARTAQLCAQPVSPNKICLIRSCDVQLAQQLGSTLAPRLDRWDIKINEDCFDTANAIVLCGSSAEDYQIPAPEYGAARSCVWIRQEYPGKKHIRREVCRRLEQSGWYVNPDTQVFESDLMVEDYAWQYEQGLIDCTTLANDEEFVLCDAYGLPLLNRDYTPEAVEKALEEFSCFGKMTERF